MKLHVYCYSTSKLNFDKSFLFYLAKNLFLFCIFLFLFLFDIDRPFLIISHYLFYYIMQSILSCSLFYYILMSGFHGAFATGVASQQGTLTLQDTWFHPPFWGLANAPIVETKFLELAMSLLDFSPRIPLGTFSILHSILF